jgi:hypothetical protein
MFAELQDISSVVNDTADGTWTAQDAQKLRLLMECRRDGAARADNCEPGDARHDVIAAAPRDSLARHGWRDARRGQNGSLRSPA